MDRQAMGDQACLVQATGARCLKEVNGAKATRHSKLRRKDSTGVCRGGSGEAARWG